MKQYKDMTREEVQARIDKDIKLSKFFAVIAIVTGTASLILNIITKYWN